MNIKCYQYLRNKIKPLGSSLVSPGVMLLRGKSGVHRCLVNEDKIAEFLRSQGFIIIDPEQTPATEIVRQMVGTKMIIGVEGSQLANGLFTVADNGVILTLQPPYRFNNIYKGRLDCLGVKYAFVLGKQVEGGFEISIEDLVKTLEKIDLG
ncbi:MAG: glycosyltransferase 61 family protein [Planktothrix sp.]